MPPLVLLLTKFSEPKYDLVEVPHYNAAIHNDVRSILKDENAKLQRSQQSWHKWYNLLLCRSTPVEVHATVFVYYNNPHHKLLILRNTCDCTCRVLPTLVGSGKGSTSAGKGPTSC